MYKNKKCLQKTNSKQKSIIDSHNNPVQQHSHGVPHRPLASALATVRSCANRSLRNAHENTPRAVRRRYIALSLSARNVLEPLSIQRDWLSARKCTSSFALRSYSDTEFSKAEALEIANAILRRPNVAREVHCRVGWESFYLVFRFIWRGKIDGELIVVGVIWFIYNCDTFTYRLDVYERKRRLDSKVVEMFILNSKDKTLKFRRWIMYLFKNNTAN